MKLKQSMFVLAILALCSSGVLAQPRSKVAAQHEAAVDAEAAVSQAQAARAEAEATRATASGPVTVTSHPGHSISGDYRIDFAAMDTDRDGVTSRAEAGVNGSLTAEFRVVDKNSDARLSREELNNWLD